MSLPISDDELWKKGFKVFITNVHKNTNLIVHLIPSQNGKKDCFELFAAPAIDDDVDAAVDHHEEPAHDVHVQLPLGVVVDPGFRLKAGPHHIVPFVIN